MLYEITQKPNATNRHHRLFFSFLNKAIELLHFKPKIKESSISLSKLTQEKDMPKEGIFFLSLSWVFLCLEWRNVPIKKLGF